VNTNFGLGSLTNTTAGTPPVTTGGFLSPKTVATGLVGLTAAVIKSDQVPIIINALKRDADTRILSSPQILVDDNEEAEIVSVDQQPTTTSTQTSGNPIQESFGGYEEAGTTLFVTPSISEGGYMRLLYEVELSNFVGVGSGGVPPPKQVRNIRSNSVTIPGDTTIVVGGIKVDAKSSTVVKVPLLGDIPLIGHLFRDTNKSNATTRLYVFITPRIMRDVNFTDLRLLTRGPRAESELPPDVPTLEPAMIERYEPKLAKGPASSAMPPAAPGVLPARREEFGELNQGGER
jgi:general secretion pathway protein D